MKNSNPFRLTLFRIIDSNPELDRAVARNIVDLIMEISERGKDWNDLSFYLANLLDLAIENTDNESPSRLREIVERTYYMSKNSIFSRMKNKFLNFCNNPYNWM